MPALVAFTAASLVSYQRLVPHRWSAAFNNLVCRDREAGVRICPEREGGDVAAQYHVEYRASDAVASPTSSSRCWSWPSCRALARASPRPSGGDLACLSAAELQAQGVQRLPTSLPAALAALAADATARSWLPPLLLDCYQKHKQGEIGALASLSEADQAKRYAEVY